MTRKLIDVRRVAEKLSLCRATVFNLQRNHEQTGFPLCIKLARSTRWDEAEIDKWLEACPRGAYGEADND